MSARLRGGPAWRGGSLGTLLFAAIGIAVAAVVVGSSGGPPGGPTGAVPSVRASTNAALASIVPSAATSPVEPSLPLPSAAPSVPMVPLRPAASPLGYGLNGSGWFQLDSTGTDSITGYRLTAGRLGWVGSYTVDLPNPAFAAGPFADLVLYGGEDGTRSEVAVLSLADGTRRVLLTSDQPVWRATLDRDAANLYYVLLDRTTRGDLGIWRLRLDGSSQAELVMEPPAWVPDPQTATTTEFVWGPAGQSLAIFNCVLGQGCRTRVLDVATGTVRSYDEVPLLGGVIGLTADSYIAYETCAGKPCPIVRVDRATGTVETLLNWETAAGFAVLLEAATGPSLVYEVLVDPNYQLMALDLTTGATRKVYSGSKDGPNLVSFFGFRNAGVPAGWLLLGPDGALRPAAPGLPSALALRLGDAVQVPLTGVTR